LARSPLLIGLDLGTSGLKAIAVCASTGACVAIAERGYQLHTSVPGAAEQDPEEWWQAACVALHELWQQRNVDPDAVAGVGLSGQMHGVVALDASGKALRPALTWADSRCAAQVEELNRLLGREVLIQRTGSAPNTSFSAPKLLWLRKHEPEVFTRAAVFLLPKDVLRLRLTGAVATDHSDASATLLYDIRRCGWCMELLDVLDIPQEKLPPVLPSGAIAGRVTTSAAAQTGLPAGIPVATGAGDQEAAAIGSDVLTEGALLVTIGTGGQLFAPLDTPRIDVHGRVHTLCHAVPDHWHLLGAILAAGLALRWFAGQFARDLVGTATIASLLKEAATVPPGSEGLIFLPYLLGERTPHFNPHARAVFAGFSLRHTRAHAARAVLEGVAFALRDGLEVLRELGISAAEPALLAGGGARSPLWRQIVADVFNRPVATRDGAATGSALGAALLGGVAAGIYADIHEATQRTIPYARVSEWPDVSRVELYQRQYERFRELFAAAVARENGG
jgi:xylulokinase